MNARLLRSALIANAVFSSICAIAFLAGAGAIAEFCGVTRAEIVSLGAGLVGFVGLLMLVITRRDLTRGWVLAPAVLIATLDVLWVVGTPLSLGNHTTGGKVMLSVIALVVGVLAAIQIRALVGIFRERSTRSLPVRG